MSIKLFAATLAAGIVATAAAPALAQQAIQWNTNGAVAAGSSCTKDVDTFFVANGNDLAVVFTSLGLNLPANSGMPMAGRASCAIRVPAKIAQGKYIAELTQRVTYGVTKTAGTQGALATRSTFFGFNVSPYTVHVPYGSSINNPLLTQSRRDDFAVNTDWWRRWCLPSRNPQGLYQANLAVTGQRDSDFEDLIMFVDGLDVKYEILSKLYTCGM